MWKKLKPSKSYQYICAPLQDIPLKFPKQTLRERCQDEIAKTSGMLAFLVQETVIFDTWYNATNSIT